MRVAHQQKKNFPGKKVKPSFFHLTSSALVVAVVVVVVAAAADRNSGSKKERSREQIGTALSLTPLFRSAAAATTTTTTATKAELVR